MSKFCVTAASRVGCVRSNNEDMVLAYDKFIRSDVYETEVSTDYLDRFVIALADGMGGHNAGEIASEMTLSNLKYYVNDLPRGFSSEKLEDAMRDWLHSVNYMVDSKGHTEPSMLEMGTTLVAVLYYEGHFYWMNCGDSRLYRLRDGKLTQLTTDHSLNNTSNVHKHSNVITNCIGGGCKNSYIDMEDFTEDIQAGDVYMICSDGLNDMVPDDVIERLLAEGATANRLCEEAIEYGGYDNVSSCVLRVMN